MKTIKVDTSNNMLVVELTEYRKLRELLQGIPEHVRPRQLKQPFCMMVDEEGVLKNLPLNLLGSMLYETDKHGCPIVGDIYFMKEEWLNDGCDIVGLTDNDILELTDYLSTFLTSSAIALKVVGGV